ncbi:MAG: hypothetical protein ACT6U0_18750 [Shinella sp.]|uniref:hypothetical protein n=1 Tax=Shinella sp. TaxID=1870904 RepID=UPI004036489F
MTDLTSLIERLEKAEAPDRELDEEIWLAAIPGASRKNLLADHPDEKPLWEYHDIERNTCFRGGIIPSYTSSIDAAVSLAERVLPGWGWSVESKTHHIMACLNPEFGEPVGKHPHWAAISNLSSRTFEDAATPAMALLLATLRSLQSKGDA